MNMYTTYENEITIVLSIILLLIIFNYFLLPYLNKETDKDKKMLKEKLTNIFRH